MRTFYGIFLIALFMVVGCTPTHEDNDVALTKKPLSAIEKEYANDLLTCNFEMNTGEIRNLSVQESAAYIWDNTEYSTAYWGSAIRVLDYSSSDQVNISIYSYNSLKAGIYKCMDYDQDSKYVRFAMNGTFHGRRYDAMNGSKMYLSKGKLSNEFIVTFCKTKLIASSFDGMSFDTLEVNGTTKVQL